MTASLDAAFVEAAEREMEAAGVDGWLLYGLEARNPVAARLLGLPTTVSRRYFVLLRPGRPPEALVHGIELSHWEGWSHGLRSYVSWREMEEALGAMLEGCGRVAMEVSELDAVPFVDNVPAGVLELVRSRGPEVSPSAGLLSRTYAQWGPAGRELHGRAGEILAGTAREAYLRAADAAAGGADSPGAAEASPASGAALTEHDLAGWILDRLAGRGLDECGVIVAVGANTALPHYHPAPERAAPIAAGRLLLIDLWGRVAGEPRAVFADQTWMGYLGAELPDEAARAWEAVREARDAAVARVGAGTELPTGAEVDAHVRSVLEGRGYGDAILHRTGHAMDRENHGYGPNLDSVETRDERRLVPGTGFSVEPGLYFRDRFGLRSEINVYVSEDGPEVTTPDVQDLPWLAG